MYRTSGRRVITFQEGFAHGHTIAGSLAWGREPPGPIVSLFAAVVLPSALVGTRPVIPSHGFARASRTARRQVEWNVRGATREWKGGAGGVRRVLGSRFIQVRNRSTYPPQERNPKGETHEDIGFLSFDSTRKRIVFRQFHVEGFVNQYVLEPNQTPDRLVFITESIENIPAGFRARETCLLTGHRSARGDLRTRGTGRRLCGLQPDSVDSHAIALSRNGRPSPRSSACDITEATATPR